MVFRGGNGGVPLQCRDGPTPLFQEKLDLEETPLQMYHPGWEPGDQLFLTRLLPELAQDYDFPAPCGRSQMQCRDIGYCYSTVSLCCGVLVRVC